jgi:hypothetical protein
LHADAIHGAVGVRVDVTGLHDSALRVELDDPAACQAGHRYILVGRTHARTDSAQVAGWARTAYSTEKGHPGRSFHLRKR